MYIYMCMCIYIYIEIYTHTEIRMFICVYSRVSGISAMKKSAPRELLTTDIRLAI